MALLLPSIQSTSLNSMQGQRASWFGNGGRLWCICFNRKKNMTAMLFLFALLCCWTGPEATAGQTMPQKILHSRDSLMRVAAQATLASTQSVNYLKIAKVYNQLGRPDSAIFWCEQGAKVNDGIMPSYYRLSLAEFYRQLARYDKVLEVLKPLEIQTYDKDGIQEQFWLGVLAARASLNLGDYPGCYQYLKLAKTYLPELKDPRAKGWWSLGMSHFMGCTYRDDSAWYYQAEAERLAKLANDPYLMVEHRLAGANTLLWGGNYAAMKLNLGIAQSMISKSIGDDVYLKMQFLSFMSDYYGSTKQLDSSKSICYQLLAIAKTVNNKEMIGAAYYKLVSSATEPNLVQKQLSLLDSAQAYFQVNQSAVYLQQLYRDRLSLIHKHKLIFAVRLDELVSIMEGSKGHYYNIQRAVNNKMQDENTGLVTSYQEANIKISNLMVMLVSAILLFILSAIGFGYQLVRAKRKSNKMRDQLHAKELAIKTLEAQLQHDEITTGYEMVRQEMDQTKHELNEVISEVHRKEHLLIELEQALRSVPRLNNNIDDLLASYKKSDVSLDDDWDTLISNFEVLRPQFFKRLAKQGPGLSRLDLKVCALMVMNVNSRAIAEMLNITDPSLRNRRSIIRKKLGLERDQELTTYLNNLQ